MTLRTRRRFPTHVTSATAGGQYTAEKVYYGVCGGAIRSGNRFCYQGSVVSQSAPLIAVALEGGYFVYLTRDQLASVQETAEVLADDRMMAAIRQSQSRPKPAKLIPLDELKRKLGM